MNPATETYEMVIYGCGCITFVEESHYEAWEFCSDHLQQKTRVAFKRRTLRDPGFVVSSYEIDTHDRDCAVQIVEFEQATREFAQAFPNHREGLPKAECVCFKRHLEQELNNLETGGYDE